MTPASQAVAAPRKQADGLRVVIVEDELLVAWHLESLVRDQHHEVCALVPDGEGAIEQAGDLDADLVLMDIRLAGRMDGIEAARRIREKSRHADHLHHRARRSGNPQAHRARGTRSACTGEAGHRRQAARRDRRGATELAHRHRRQRVDIGDDVDHGRTVSGERLRQRALDPARMLDADTERAHFLGDACKVRLAERP